MTKEILLSGLEKTTQQLMNILLSFTPERFNEKPAENEWSAAQIAEHLLKVDMSTCKALSGEAIPSNRPPDAKIDIIKQAMDDDNTRRVAPERVYPSSEHWEPVVIIQQIKKQKAFLKEAILGADVTEACMSFKHPALGTMTKMEWVAFNIHHTERHLRQLKGLQERLG
jgi:hypothetical protein